MSRHDECFNEQWLTFFLGLFFLLPFLIGVFLPFLRSNNRFPTISYQIGFFFNILFFIGYIVGIVYAVTILHKKPEDLISTLSLTESPPPPSFPTPPAHGH